MGSGFTFKVALFPLPSPSQWSDVLTKHLSRIESNLRKSSHRFSIITEDYVQGTPRPTREDIDSIFLPLWNEFSDEVICHATFQGYDGARTSSENEVLDRTFGAFVDSLRSDDHHTFIKWIQDVSSCLATANVGIRVSDVFTRRNKRGIRSKFPPSSMIQERLEEIHRFIRQNYSRQPAFTATIAMVAIANCHPLSDGNGRTSRIIFNAIMRQAVLKASVYVPLHDLFWLSGFGYEVRMVSATLTDEWQSLFKYMGDLSEIYLQLVSVRPKQMGDFHVT